MLLRSRAFVSSIIRSQMQIGCSIQTLCYLSHSEEDMEMKEFLHYIDSLKNYEKSGIPTGAGTDSPHGFDLSRMTRLMHRFGNPHSNFKAVHIAGTKGKGSTAAFISNILRIQGYSVGCYTSPHIQTIRERILLGRSGNPVSAKVLNNLFLRIKQDLDQAMKEENGCISHFEVFTTIAFILFAEENIDIAVIEAGLGGARDATNIISSSGLVASVITTVGEEHLAALGGSLETIAMAKAGIIKQGRPLVLGGPFLPHIERIIRDKAVTMDSPVISASDTGNRCTVKSFSMLNGRSCQICDIVIQAVKDLKLSCKLLDVKLQMLGSHQLQNAATATCVALCLRYLGWKISDESIRSGLEQTRLLGRSQFLTSEEAEVLGLTGATILLDGAHTKESAKALMNSIRMALPEARLAFVVAMANDKDHVGFAREILSGIHVQTVLLTEAAIAGGVTRTTPASLLRDSWIKASEELGIGIVHDGMAEYRESLMAQPVRSKSNLGDRKTILATESSLKGCLRTANNILIRRRGDEMGVIVITGSLHISFSFNTMYKLLPQLKTQVPDNDNTYESSSNAAAPLAEFLCEAVFSGDKFHVIEAAYGQMDGVIRTATGYCGGTLKKPTYREVCEGRTGHTEAVKVIYDKRKVSYQSLCDLFWESHDPTKKEYLNFGIDTHQRSAIFYCTGAERKQAQQSKIRKQMKLNKRIVTKITPLGSEFFLAENQHQKFFLQKHSRLCECLGLRSTEQFVESDIACKLNGILGLEGEIMITELSTFLNTHNMSKQAKLACEDLVEELRAKCAKGNDGSL